MSEGADEAAESTALDIYEVLQSPDHAAFADLGLCLWSLVATPWDWIDRRVETVTLVGERRFRRHMSIDCRVPATVLDLAEGLGFDRFFVPLRLVAERPLLSFDLQLEDRPVPSLTRPQNTLAERALLQAAVEQLGRPLTSEIVQAIDDVTMVGSPAAAKLLDLLELSPERHLGVISREALVTWAITTLDRSFMLLGDVALEDLRHRTLFKVTEELGPDISARLPLLSEIAWFPTQFVFDAQDVVATSSYHFQFIAPDGLVVDGGELVATTERGNRDGDEEVERVRFGTSAGQGQVLGVHSALDTVPEADDYSVEVRLHPAPDGLLRASAVSACFSALLLFLAALFVHRVDDERLEASTALLLVLPGIVSTMILRPGEHTLVARLLRGTRTLLLASSITVYFAAASVMGGVSQSTLRVLWFVLAACSAVPAVALSVATHRCRPRESAAAGLGGVQDG